LKNGPTGKTIVLQKEETEYLTIETAKHILKKTITKTTFKNNKSMNLKLEAQKNKTDH